MNPPKFPHHYFTWKGREWSLYKRRTGPLAPWFFKVDNKPQSLKTADAAAAVRAAKVRLELRAGDGRHAYSDWLDEQASRASLTVATVAAKWLAAGCPWRGGTPRPDKARATQAATLERALKWWGEKNVAAVTESQFGQFADWRRGQVSARAGTGDRSIDLELLTLHQCFDWAVGAGHVRVDPFAVRPRYRHARDVEHCSAEMPRDDEELHRLIAHVAADPAHVCHAAQLMFQALTGLRSGEPGFLRVDTAFSPQPLPGRRYTIRPDGIEREVLAVRRLKGGINPAVSVTPALAAFLAAWLPLRAIRWPDSPFYFPDPFDPTQPLVAPEDKRKRLETHLTAAAVALGTGPRKPHGLRAYYVQVRRSQGAMDAQIAIELGQGSGPGLIVRTYGSPQTVFGSGHFDWLPSPESGLQPAWESFSPQVLSAPSSGGY